MCALGVVCTEEIMGLSLSISQPALPCTWSAKFLLMPLMMMDSTPSRQSLDSVM